MSSPPVSRLVELTEWKVSLHNLRGESHFYVRSALMECQYYSACPVSTSSYHVQVSNTFVYSAIKAAAADESTVAAHCCATAKG